MQQINVCGISQGAVSASTLEQRPCSMPRPARAVGMAVPAFEENKMTCQIFVVPSSGRLTYDEAFSKLFRDLKCLKWRQVD